MAENNKKIELEENEILRISVRQVEPDADGHDIKIFITRLSEEDDLVNDIADIFVEAMESEYEDFVPIYEDEETE